MMKINLLKGRTKSEEEKRERESKKRRCLVPWIIAVICALLALGVYFNEKAKRTELIAAKKAVEAKLQECEKKAAAEAWQRKLELGIPKYGDGITRLIAKQFESDSSLTKGVSVKVQGKVYDLAHKSVGAAAYLLARNLGYISIDGREVRIRFPGIVSYVVLRQGNNLSIQEIERGPDGKFKSQPTETKTSSSLKTLMFEGEGDQAGALQKYYERVHTPQRAHASAALPALFTIEDILH